MSIIGRRAPSGLHEGELKRDIVWLLVLKYTTEAIAKELNISPLTVSAVAKEINYKNSKTLA